MYTSWTHSLNTLLTILFLLPVGLQITIIFEVAARYMVQRLPAISFIFWHTYDILRQTDEFHQVNRKFSIYRMVAHAICQ